MNSSLWWQYGVIAGLVLASALYTVRKLVPRRTASGCGSGCSQCGSCASAPATPGTVQALEFKRLPRQDSR